MGRFSPTVVKDTTQTERPGQEVASAFSTYFQEKQIESDRADVAEDRARQMKREDLLDVVGQGEFEDYLRDRYGATPSYTDQGLGGGGFETGPGPGIEGQDPRGVPSGAPDAFRDVRMGIGEPAGPLTQPVDLGPEQVVALPGQFVGGGFSPEAITIGGPQQPPTRETREFAGQTYDIDPTQTLEQRTLRGEEQERTRLSAEEEAKLQEEIKALVAAGVPEAQARAYAMFDEEGEALERATTEEPEGFDPDRAGQFGSQAEYIAFQRELASAKDAVGRRPPGAGAAAKPPIALEDAMAQVDELVGTWNPDTQSWDHTLSQGERYDIAVRMSQGELTGEELDALAGRGQEEVAPPAEFEAGAFKRFWQRAIPGGKHGFEQVGGGEGPLEPPPDVSARPHDAPPVEGGDWGAVHDSIGSIIEQLKAEYPNLGGVQIKDLLTDEFDERDVMRVLRGR